MAKTDILDAARVVAFLLLSAAPPGCGGDDSGPTGPSSMPTPGAVRWMFTGETWQASGAPPACPTPLVFTTPVDLARVTSILYPGQSRGGGYRPHGGFRFDGPGESGSIAVIAPLAAEITRAARYLERGELQYLFEFVNACGIMYRFDHLRNLSARLQQAAAVLPAANEGDSRTADVPAGLAVTAGETLAEGLGAPVAGNVFVDWGVYDLRSSNQASMNGAWLAQHRDEFSPFAICWLDNLAPGDAAVVRSLPPSGDSGSRSDYCH